MVPTAVTVLLLLSVPLLSTAADPVQNGPLIRLDYAMYILIAVLAFHCVLLTLCCMCLIGVCCFNNRETEQDDEMKQEEEISPPVSPSPPTSLVYLDPESPTNSAIAHSNTDNDKEPLLHAILGDKDPSMRERTPSHKHKVHPPRVIQEDIKMQFPRHSPKMQYRPLTPGGKKVVSGGVTNPAYEEEVVPTILKLKSELIPIADKWYSIGLQLKVPTRSLSAIQRESRHDSEVCLVKMCEAWLQKEMDPSWEDIILALRSKVVSEYQIADVIQMRYCEETEFFTRI